MRHDHRSSRQCASTGSLLPPTQQPSWGTHTHLTQNQLPRLRLPAAGLLDCCVCGKPVPPPPLCHPTNRQSTGDQLHCHNQTPKKRHQCDWHTEGCQCPYIIVAPRVLPDVQTRVLHRGCYNNTCNAYYYCYSTGSGTRLPALSGAKPGSQGLHPGKPMKPNPNAMQTHHLSNHPASQNRL